MRDYGESSKTLRNPTRTVWRSWLRRNHSRAEEAWPIFYKMHTGKGKMSYLEALDEALCFGWIDGRLQRIDDEKHRIRFSPRRKGSVWSEGNIRRVRRLVGDGRMTPAGLAKIDRKTLNRPISKKGRPRYRLSSEMKKRLMIHEKAWRNYRDLAPSSREMYAYWLSSARKPETKERRLKVAVALLTKNKKLGMS